MKTSSLIGPILASVFANAMRQRGRAAATGAGPGVRGGGLGDLLGGMMGRGGAPSGLPAGRTSAFGGRGALMALLLPLAMQWVQRNGGLGAVLGKLRQKGYRQQAASWVSTGANEDLPSQAVQEVVGSDELSRLSQQLGVSQQEVADGFAQILPEMVDRLTPQGDVPPDADDVLTDGMSELEAALRQARTA